MPTIVQAIEALAKGKGVFKGDPLFLMADGQVVDKDGREVIAASEIGAAAYTAHVGFFPSTSVVPAAQLPLATSGARGAVIAATKGTGDTVEVKIGSDGKLYVPAYPADSQYDVTAFMVDVDEVAAAKPVAYNDGDIWVDEGAAKIYIAADEVWVEVTANKVVETTAAPALYVVGDFFVKQNAGADELFEQVANAWVAHVGTFTEAATAPATPTAGDYYYDTATSKLYYCAVDTWAEVTGHTCVRAAAAPVIYVEGDYFLDTDTSDKLYKVVEGAWVEQTTMQHIYQATAPTLYPLGYLLADEDTKKIYEREASDWDAGTALVSGKFYTDGTYVYVFGSGSLAKI